MKCLLKADDNIEKKRQIVHSGIEIVSKVDFQNKRNNIHQGPSILSNK